MTERSPRRFHRADGQALTFVALTIAILVGLTLGVNEVALRRRTQTRIQDSLDQAAAAAAVELDPASLAANAPGLLSAAAEARFRTMLRTGLSRVASAVESDPATLAQQAHVSIVPAGGQCAGRTVIAPAVCASLTVKITGVLGTPQVTVTTLAQALRGP
jgi:hypothetical protein